MAKKKAKKKKPVTPGIDPNERRRERLEARRAEKARALAAQRKKERRDRIVRIVSLATLGTAAFWFFFLRGTTPETISGHAIQEVQGGPNVTVHTEQPVDYEETPPVIGQHSGTPAPCGIHGQQLVDEEYVHSLEHGAVAVLYDPTQVDANTVTTIEDIVGSYEDHTISAPYEGMDQGKPIYVTSWGKRMALDSLDEGAVREYIDTFLGKGRETEDCDNTADDPFDTSTLPDATPTPTPTWDKGAGTKEDGKGDDKKDQ